MKPIFLFIVLSLLSTASLASEHVELKHENWSFDGITGTFDRQSIQRGYQVYKEVCSSCHSMKLKSYRNLMDIGFSEPEVKTIAASVALLDGPNDSGDMFERPARPSDRFISPFPNDKAARAANGGALPPDLSLIIKARENGANYVYSLLTGYEEPPSDMVMNAGMNYNKYFPGHQIAMARPLQDGQITYMDNTRASTEQMAKDVVNFLQWAAEPEMESRKRMGLKVLVYLAVFTGLFIAVKRKIWQDVH